MTADFQSRRRYLGRTNGGILRLLAQALNDSVRVQREVSMTADTCAVDAGGSPSPPSSSRSGDPPVRGMAVRQQWTRRPAISVIQRAKPVESPMEGQGTQPWPREGRPLLRHPREAGIPRSGAGRYVVVAMLEPTVRFFGRSRSH